MRLHYLIMLIVCNIAKTGFAQHNPHPEIGIKLMAEANSRTGSTMPLTGFQVVYQLKKHGGIESGLYYRPVKNTLFVSYYDPGTNFNYTGVAVISEKYLHIPVLYRYQSRIINFTAGTSFDLFLGWKDKSENASLKVNSYNPASSIQVGAVVSISKSILLSEKIILEPEVRFNPIITSEDPYVHSAFGFAFRRKF